jgi:hypothetical protein
MLLSSLRNSTKSLGFNASSLALAREAATRAIA